MATSIADYTHAQSDVDLFELNNPEDNSKWVIFGVGKLISNDERDDIPDPSENDLLRVEKSTGLVRTGKRVYIKKGDPISFTHEIVNPNPNPFAILAGFNPNFFAMKVSV